MKVNEILEKAKNNNGLFIKDNTVDRYSPRFENWKFDNSFNWYDLNIYTFEIIQKDNLTFCLIPNNDQGDPRGLSYEDNIVLFTDIEDFYSFVDEIKEENEDD